MPLVHIDVPADKPTEYGTVIAAAVHQAMVEWLNVPQDDVFQLVTRQATIVANDGYLGIRRDDPVFVEITLRRGRTTEQKVGFYRAAAKYVQEQARVEKRNLFFALTENGNDDWSFGDGEAQYA